MIRIDFTRLLIVIQTKDVSIFEKGIKTVVCCVMNKALFRFILHAHRSYASWFFCAGSINIKNIAKTVIFVCNMKHICLLSFRLSGDDASCFVLKSRKGCVRFTFKCCDDFLATFFKKKKH